MTGGFLFLSFLIGVFKGCSIIICTFTIYVPILLDPGKFNGLE